MLAALAAFVFRTRSDDSKNEVAGPDPPELLHAVAYLGLGLSHR